MADNFQEILGNDQMQGLLTSIRNNPEMPEVPMRPVALDNRIAAMAALVDGKLQKLPPASAFQMRKAQVVQDPTYEITRRQVAEQTLLDMNSGIDNHLMDLLDQGNFDTASEEVQIADELKQKNQDAVTTMSVEEAFVENTSTTFDEQRQKEAIYQAELFRHVTGLFEDQGTVDQIVNWGGLLLLSDQTLDWSRVLGTNYMNTPSAVANFVKNWQALPPETKLNLLPQLKEDIYAATDKNNVKTAIALMDLLEREAPVDIESELRMDQAFMALDVTAIGGIVFNRLARLTKASSSVSKAARNAGNAEDAAKIELSALADESGEIAKATNVDKVTAASDGVGFKMEEIMPEATDGIAPEMQHLMNEIETGRQAVRTQLNQVISGDAFIKETALTESRKARIQQDAVEELHKLNEEAYAAYGWTIDDAKITNKTETGYTLEYNYNGVPVKQDRQYTLSDIGTFDELNTGAIEKGITSPSYHMQGIDERFVESATNIELASAGILDVFNRTVDNIARDTIGSPVLHKKQYRELDSVLLHGDDYANADGTFGKVFTVDELRTGIDTDIGTVRLNDKQIKAYYQLRELFDNAWVMKNNEVRRWLDLHGFTEINYEGSITIGKPFDRIQDASRSLKQNKVTYVYDPMAKEGAGGVVPVENVDFKKMYEDGFKLVRFKEPQNSGTKGFVDFAMIKPEDVRKLPPRVMLYKKGYVPKIYKDGFYFVKEEMRGTLNGVSDQVVGNRTLRMFDSRRGAEAFAAKLYQDNPGTGSGTYKVLHDREMDQAALAKEAVGFSGGLYTSPRATHPILFNEEGLTPRRLSAFESMQRNLNHLATYLPRNEWRVGMQQKWINTARAHGMLDGNDFNAALIGEKHSKEWNALESAREYIRDQMRIPTTNERWFEATSRSLAEWAENPLTLKGKELASARLPKFARTSLQTMAHKDPFALARSTAFHSLLGWFNPAQLFVQAQGASIALSLYPEHAHKVLWEGMALRPLMHLAKTNTDLATVRKMSDNIAKAMGMDPDDLFETYKLWNKTNLQKSIKATADHAAAAQNFGFGINAFKKAADKGLVFYREGELFTRGFAFLTAKRVWKQANPNKAIGDAELKQILDHAMQLQLNLTRANRAVWQKGAWSIPTQFLQIQTKYIEKVVPKFLGGRSELAGHQKLKLLGMQFAIYGAAGVPFGEWAINEIVQATGMAPEEMDPDTKRYLAGGFWDMLFYNTFGADAELGRRGAIVSGVEDFVRSAIYDRAPLGEAMFGAFGATGSRAFETIAKVAPMVYNADQIEWTDQEYKYVASSFGNILSSWRNVDKAIFMARFGYVTDRHGNVLLDRQTEGGFKMSEVLARGMGFNLKDISNTYKLDMIGREWDRHINERVDALMRLHYEYANNADHEGAARNLQLMQEALLSDLNDYDTNLVYRRVHTRIKRSETKEEKALNKWYNDIASDSVDANPYFGGPYTNTIIPTEEEQ